MEVVTFCHGAALLATTAGGGGGSGNFAMTHAAEPSFENRRGHLSSVSCHSMEESSAVVL